MKKTLLVILLLQLASLISWQIYVNGIKDTRSTAIFEAGRNAGKHEMQLYLFNHGVEIPDSVRIESTADVRGDHWTVQDTGFLQLAILAYFPALGLAGIAAVALSILVIQQPATSSNTTNKKVEQGGDGDAEEAI